MSLHKVKENFKKVVNCEEFIKQTFVQFWRNHASTLEKGKNFVKSFRWCLKIQEVEIYYHSCFGKTSVKSRHLLLDFTA